MLHWRDRVAALRDADLFVLPSYSENFGIAVVEALAAGTPVVVSDQVALHGEIAAGGVGGVVPLDVERLAAEIERWLGDKALRESARARSRALVWQKFDWNQIARRWKSHYARLMTQAVVQPSHVPVAAPAGRRGNG
jgi:glycosyltransferase involved in cell wall biosynthesis